jgi:hypothetical protein
LDAIRAARAQHREEPRWIKLGAIEDGHDPAIVEAETARLIAAAKADGRLRDCDNYYVHCIIDPAKRTCGEAQ